VSCSHSHIALLQTSPGVVKKVKPSTTAKTILENTASTVTDMFSMMKEQMVQNAARHAVEAKTLDRTEAQAASNNAQLFGLLGQLIAKST
jgi:hypothetical protein